MAKGGSLRVWGQSLDVWAGLPTYVCEAPCSAGESWRWEESGEGYVSGLALLYFQVSSSSPEVSVLALQVLL